MLASWLIVVALPLVLVWLFERQRAGPLPESA
jgi:hypothetical protein